MESVIAQDTRHMFQAQLGVASTRLCPERRKPLLLFPPWPLTSSTGDFFDVGGGEQHGGATKN